MKKILALLLLLSCFIPEKGAAQSDDALNYTRMNRPCEANFKFKDYNTAAIAYNRERQDVKKERGEYGLFLVGVFAGGFLFVEGMSYALDEKTNEKAALLTGVGAVIVSQFYGLAPPTKRAFQLHNTAMAEKKKAGH